jgi:hypothetical protein
MNQRRPTWRCPICNSVAPYERCSIFIYFSILISLRVLLFSHALFMSHGFLVVVSISTRFTRTHASRLQTLSQRLRSILIQAGKLFVMNLPPLPRLWHLLPRMLLMLPLLIPKIHLQRSQSRHLSLYRKLSICFLASHFDFQTSSLQIFSDIH